MDLYRRLKNIRIVIKFSMKCIIKIVTIFENFKIMIRPKRTRYRKPHRGRLKGPAYHGNYISFGDFGIQNITPCWITSRQIESGRRVLTRYVRRIGTLWIRIFPQKPITLRPAETRIGSGKGTLEYWVAFVRPGNIIFEIYGISETIARQAIQIASSKFPTKVRFIRKKHS
jgi:large subunit ribosomal protein L16